MYESPINLYFKKRYEAIEDVVLSTIKEQIGVTIDKDELTKALLYDRNQYNKGYYDGQKKIAKDIILTLRKKAFDLNGDHPESDFRFLVVDVKDIIKTLEKITE